MKHFQKSISVAIEENKQRHELLEEGRPLYEIDTDVAEETAFSNEEYKRMFKMISIQLFGEIDKDFIQQISNRNLISNTEIAQQKLEEKIQIFSTYILPELEV